MVPFKKLDLVQAKIGLPQQTAPKRKDFISLTNRKNSFLRWPERVQQTPKELAEAGFFYCGLSDHVCCFHCGGGLRNWEKDADPWEEHARGYPECYYLIIIKGQEFIDKIWQEKPPVSKASSAVRGQATINDQELDPLMELDIIKAILDMGAPADKVRATLRRKLQQTGQSFFKLWTCVEAVLQYIDEENRPSLQ